MHKKIARLLMNASHDTNYVEGRAAISYTAKKVNSLVNVRVYGNSNISYGSFGNNGTSNKITIRTHGSNFMGGALFKKHLTANLSSYSCTSVSGNILTYDFKDTPAGTNVTTPNAPPFKENTRYTIRFSYTGASGKSTGLAVLYTDGESDEIVAPSSGNELAFTTKEGKTISAIVTSNLNPGSGVINLGTFGIFEGERPYSDFQEYSGTEHTFTPASPLSSITMPNGSILCDVFDWSTKTIESSVATASIGRSNVTLYDDTASISIAKIALPSPADIINPASKFYTYTYKNGYSDIVGKWLCYTFLDENNVALSMRSKTNESGCKSEFSTPKFIIYKRLETKFINVSGHGIGGIRYGYIGIEAYGGNVLPSKIRVYHKV